MIRYDLWRNQVVSTVKSTAWFLSQPDPTPKGLVDELYRLFEHPEELKTQISSLDKEKVSMSAYHDQFSPLIPSKPVK